MFNIIDQIIGYTNAAQGYDPYNQQNGGSGQYGNATQANIYSNMYRNRYVSDQWVWNGRAVSITEFADLAYGDSAQKTAFLLKHSDKKEMK
jgi:hypothetical protein